MGMMLRKYIYEAASKVNNVDLEKLLLKLDYNGQDYVINKNIKGHLNRTN